MEKGELDYMGFDRLAELTMSILQRMKEKILNVATSRICFHGCGHCCQYKEKGVRMLTNAGGANPEQAENDVLVLSKELGIDGMKIGVGQW